MYVMLIHENDVPELRVEARFGVCDPGVISYTARKFVDFVLCWKQTRR